MLKSPIKIVSRPVVSAIDISFLNKSIHCECALGGDIRYKQETVLNLATKIQTTEFQFVKFQILDVVCN